MEPTNISLHPGEKTSGTHSTIWLDTISQQNFETLTSDVETDVLVIGGGIAGISTAYCLVKAGKKVILIEDGLLYSGETGRTTAHIVNALDDRYSDLIKMHGKENARLVADSHSAAIDFIERASRELQTDCDFTRLNGYLFLHDNDTQKTLDDELKATHEAGIQTTMLDHVPGIPAEKGSCLQFPAQAQFHPLKYLNGLVKYISENGGTIYTHTHAESFKEQEVKANGFSIKATHIVVATNSPINNMLTHHTKQHAYRTYVIGGLVPAGAYQQALWWDTGDPDTKWVIEPYHYVRLQQYNNRYDLLIAGGEDHKTGQEDDENLTAEERYQRLEKWTRQRFDKIKDITYQWSGQVLEPVDSLAFIGKNPSDEHTYVITGESGNGMTYGTIGGMLVSDLILGNQNPWTNLYDPGRITLMATGAFLEEAGNMALQYGDFLKAGDVKSTGELANGTGAIMNEGGHKVAVYKDEQGAVYAYTAVCPHLGCVVQWNHDEKSFDCPCHGSRFTCEGKVINGPALSDLAPHHLNHQTDNK
ncbi:MAG: FAD-dependent oxidoreductase [Chitinophagaceae bacterium]|nr:FAD-dependent oxidoreductase [Chitinophagaceae bacterium]